MATHYIAVIEDAGPNRAHGVWFPDLPGCFSAGDTLEEALANAPEAAGLWLEVLAKAQWPRARTQSELRADALVADEIRDFGDNVVFVAVPVSTAHSVAAE
ncbi:MAG: type II toxin-antitoxin system HicB family antitoxin [Beijerinckiaceae bacterium]